MIKRSPVSFGFTLVEIIVSLLLLTLLTVATFKSAHFVHRSANAALVEFLNLQNEKSALAVTKLKQSYTTITVDKEFSHLDCLIKGNSGCVQIN